MVEKLKQLKDELLEQIEKDKGAKGIERIDTDLVDAVKDLAEAEKACWEAEYYRAVSEQMGASGYMPDGMRYGYQGQQGRPGWQDRYGGYRRGYGDAVEGVRNILASATPEEKERIKAEMRSM